MRPSRILVVPLLLGLAGAQEAPPNGPRRVDPMWHALTGATVHVAPGVSLPEATVVLKGDTWHATFEGECGRPYKYTVKMEGRQAGGVVLFKGTADLGEKDGGVFDWIGRANEKDFVGFFTSAGYTGVFVLKKAAQ